MCKTFHYLLLNSIAQTINLCAYTYYIMPLVNGNMFPVYTVMNAQPSEIS